MIIFELFLHDENETAFFYGDCFKMIVKQFQLVLSANGCEPISW